MACSPYVESVVSTRPRACCTSASSLFPPKSDISQPDMIEVKRAAARALLKQDGIFSGLKRSDEPGTTEAHLIEMLTAG